MCHTPGPLSCSSLCKCMVVCVCVLGVGVPIKGTNNRHLFISENTHPSAEAQNTKTHPDGLWYYYSVALPLVLYRHLFICVSWNRKIPVACWVIPVSNSPRLSLLKAITLSKQNKIRFAHPQCVWPHLLVILPMDIQTSPVSLCSLCQPICLPICLEDCLVMRAQFTDKCNT